MLERLVKLYLRTPDHPAKLRLLDALLDVSGALPVEVSGARLLVDGRDHIGRHLLFHGAFEPQTLALAQRLLGGGGVFVDIGANLGLYSVVLSANPAVSVVAVEPDPANFCELTRNIALNDRRNVRACNVALAAGWGFVGLERPNPGNRGMTRVAAAPTHMATTLHAATSADALFAALQVERIDVLKMDVEGYEATVLRGMELSGPLRPRHVIMERNGLDQGAMFAARRMTAHERLLEAAYVPFGVLGEPLDEASPPVEDNVWYRSVDGT